jgi:RND family efflux transporter MFP subunit
MKPAAVLAFSLLSLTVFDSCSSSSGKGEASVKEEPAIETISLKKGKLASSLRLPGELQAWQQVDLYAKENSFVKKLYVDVGSEVKAGQLLATMDAPELSARLSGAQSRLKSAEAVYMGSKANYDRLYETSKTPGTISQNDLDQAAARKNADYAQYEAAKAAYREVTDTRNYLEIRAPFAGVISARNANAGAYAGPSGKGSELPLFTLQQQNKLRLVVSIPEAFTGYLNDQDEITFSVKSLPGQIFHAIVNRSAGALDNRLRSERVEMDVANNDKKLLPGMIAEVSLKANQQDSTFIVPKKAVVTTTERVFVIKVDNGKATWIDVKKGREADGKVEVFGMLQSGDQLVKTATDEIRDSSAIAKTKPAL